MMLTSRDDLSIAEIACYIPALAVGLIVGSRHGFGRASGWLFLCILSVLRIVGASCQIAADQDPSGSDVRTLLTISFIFTSIGVSLIVQALLGVLIRVHAGMNAGQAIPVRAFVIVSLPLLVGIILGIVGGTKVASSNVDERPLGRDLQKASNVIYLLVYIVVTAAVVFTLTRLRSCIASERRLVIASALCLPLLLVRIIYSLAVAFSSLDSTTFSLFSPNIWVYAFMAVAEEFIIVAILLAAGLTTPRVQRNKVQDGSLRQDQEELRNYKEVSVDERQASSQDQRQWPTPTYNNRPNGQW